MNEVTVGLIGGSGLGEVLRQQAAGAGASHVVDTPFGRPSDAIVEVAWEGLRVLLLARHGPGHVLGPSQVPYRANIFALKQLGCTHIIASGAVGSLRDEFRPRDLVVPDQIIDRTTRRAHSFFEHAAVHVEFAEPFCPVLRQILLEESDGSMEGSGIGVQGAGSAPSTPNAEPRGPNHSFRTHGRGCYVCMEGPAFSTRAESHMHRLWGGDLIGMTAMPEAKLAREAEIAYALVALVTDYDCWRKPPPPPPAPARSSEPPAPAAEALLKEIIANLQAASDNAAALIRRALGRIARNPAPLADAPALRALQLAIWTDRARIPKEQVERLGPLWMKYV